MQTFRIVSEFTDDYLEHHGVKGQKWGVIRTPQQLGHKKPKKEHKFVPPVPTTRKEVIKTFLAPWLFVPMRLIPYLHYYRTDEEYRRKADAWAREINTRGAIYKTNLAYPDKNTSELSKLTDIGIRPNMTFDELMKYDPDKH